MPSILAYLGAQIINIFRKDILYNTINFSKLHGQGNDFIIIDAISREIRIEKEEILKMCDRHFGIGADGLILARKLKDDYFFHGLL